MGVLSRSEIIRRLELPIAEGGSLFITPLDEGSMDFDSVDLRLGCYFRVPAISSTRYINPRPRRPGTASSQHSVLVHKPLKSRWGRASFYLQPQHSVLAGTLEYIKMPADVSGQVLTKSSWARLFVTVESAPWIHPFFRGCLTLEITNLGNVAVALPAGEPIAQLVFETIDSPDDAEQDRIRGSYAGAVLPEAPRFK
jgi:dCTP deaminase